MRDQSLMLRGLCNTLSSIYGWGGGGGLFLTGAAFTLKKGLPVPVFFVFNRDYLREARDV